MNTEGSKKRSNKIISLLIKTACIVLGVVVLSTVLVFSKPLAEGLSLFSAALSMPGAGEPVRKGDALTDSDVSDVMSTIRLPSASEVIVSGQDDELETPADIVELMNKAQADMSSAKRGGDIIEQQYTSGSPYTGYKNLWVMNTTGKTLDLSTLYTSKPRLEINDDKPAILIYHTHTSESYVALDVGWYSSDFTSRSSDCGQNMARVGQAMAEELEKAGFNVVHDKTIYDSSYNGAYQRSRAQVELYLELYPSIVITLDVHRDALTTNNEQTIIKPVTMVNGKKAAQIMLIAGREGGTITSFPSWENNLKFAVQIQNKMNELYPDVMRPVFHCYRMYNMDLTPNSLLVEVGTHGNTLEEAVYSGTLFGKALAEMLQDYAV